jgi:3-keto-5-aminohexanoate cleavage enzyme
MEKLIIEVALNEVIMREQNPHVPISPDEIAQDAYDCCNAGASIVHFHARDAATGKNLPTDTALYAESLEKIKAKCDVISYPTESYKPNVPSVNPHIRELAFNVKLQLEMAFMFVKNAGLIDEQGRYLDPLVETGAPEHPNTFLRFCMDTGVKPKFVVRELGDVRHLVACRNAGLIADPITCHLRLHDRLTFGPTPDARGLLSFLDAVPQQIPFVWFVHPLDFIDPKLHFQLNAVAVGSGGHCRTGLGDQVLSFGVPESNPQMVERIIAMAQLTGRDIASPNEARDILKMRRKTMEEIDLADRSE